jgi:hypothetical protein
VTPSPPPVPGEPPPPATIKASTNLVPGCVVIFPEDVLDVTTHFPKEVVFVLPIIPPLDLAMS